MSMSEQKRVVKGLRRPVEKLPQGPGSKFPSKQFESEQISPASLTAPVRATAQRQEPPATLAKPKTTRQTIGKLPPQRASVGSDALDYISQSLDGWRSDYQRSLDRFVESASGKNVHDLRVAIRRLSTVFDLIDRLNPDNMVRRARRKLKDESSALSSLRDAHVEMVRMRDFLKKLPEMKPFYDELASKEAKQLKAVQKIRWKKDKRFVKVSCNRATIRLNARRTTSSGESTRRIIEATTDGMFDTLSKKLGEVTKADFASIHQLRIAFRPLRYTLEIIQPLVGVDRKQLRTAALLARIMGRIQDLEVLMKDLVESNWRRERELAAVAEIWVSLERQKLEAAELFFKSIPKFGKLWKPIIHEHPTVMPVQSQTLFVLRHGIAVSRGDPDYPLDSDRPLTPKGIKRMGRISDGMRRIRVGFDQVLSSPYKRALETAFIVAREYEAGQDVQTLQALKAEVLPEEVIRTLLDKFSTCERLLLVGHEPQLSALISTLTSGSASARPLLKKGGLCRLQVEGLKVGKCATLEWLLTPKQLIGLA